MTGTFIHIPKAAGKTLKQSLSPHFTRRCSRHHTAASVFKHHPELQNSPTVVSVRNPWERIWSFYRYTKQIHIHNIDWDEWLYSPILNGSVYRHYDDVDCDRNPLSLKTWVTDLDGNELVTDYIMFSNLSSDIDTLAEKYNIDIVLKTRKHSTDGKGKGYAKHYTNKQREYVADVCAWEINKFNFKFK
jgi:hypothetical protein